MLNIKIERIWVAFLQCATSYWVLTGDDYMADWKAIDKKLIPTIPLRFDDGMEDMYEDCIQFSISIELLADMPHLDPGQQKQQLRKMMSSIFHEHLDGNYDLLEARCDIKRDTFQKILRAHGGRGLSRAMLAKFAVGAGIDVSTADELFLCHGASLDRRSRFDYILMCAIKYSDDIETFDKTLVEYSCQSVLSKPD